jgi:hypothetical protein
MPGVSVSPLGADLDRARIRAGLASPGLPEWLWPREDEGEEVPFESLTSEQKQVAGARRQIVRHGKRLYARSPEDKDTLTTRIIGKPLPGLASPGIPGGGATGMENLSTEDLKRIANGKNASPFRRMMAQRLLMLRAKGELPPNISELLAR